MRRRGWAVCLLGWMLAVGVAGAAWGAAVGVAMLVGRIQQLGPAYPGREVGLAVQVRNIGQGECGPCVLRAFGGGASASRPLPRIRPGEMIQVTLGGLVFPRPGTFVLTVGVDGPRDQVDFGPKKPTGTFEMTVLEGAPPGRGPGR